MPLQMSVRSAVLAGCALTAMAQASGAQATADAKKDTAGTPKIFTSEALLPITLSTNIKQLRGDKSDTSPYRAATIIYAGADGKPVSIPLRVKTHGIWRLKHCDFPPLRLNFSNKTTKKTVFHDLEKPKFVNVCHNTDSYEQYVLQEFQLYRIYQVLTPASHRARLLRVTYADSASGKEDATRYAFLFEDPDQLALRLGGKMIKTKGAIPDDIDPAQGAIAYLFEFLIGNTDFSFNGLHNGELVLKADGSNLVPVAYDFDFSGAVNAPYATVDPKLPIRRVRQRLFRGYCAFKADYPAAIALFQQRKDAIYALYHDELGKLIDPKVVRETLEYFDDFYKEIKTPGDALGTCVGSR
ncbi:MAG: hypothetical protein ABJE47_03405 [bacterium]